MQSGMTAQARAKGRAALFLFSDYLHQNAITPYSIIIMHIVEVFGIVTALMMIN
jgi:hypothetical protein